MGQHVRNVPPTAPFPHAVKIRQHPRVEVDCGAAHALRVQPTAPLHMLSKEKKDSLTLLPQHHLDHFNNLLLDLWYRTIHDLLPDKCTSTRAVAWRL